LFILQSQNKVPLDSSRPQNEQVSSISIYLLIEEINLSLIFSCCACNMVVGHMITSQMSRSHSYITSSGYIIPTLLVIVTEIRNLISEYAVSNVIMVQPYHSKLQFPEFLLLIPCTHSAIILTCT